MTSKRFDLLKLPFLALKNCLLMSDIYELINISLCSDKVRKIVKQVVGSKSILKDCDISFEHFFNTFIRSCITIKRYLKSRKSSLFPQGFSEKAYEKYYIRIRSKATPAESMKAAGIMIDLSKGINSLEVTSLKSGEELRRIVDFLSKYQSAFSKIQIAYAGPDLSPDNMHHVFDSVKNWNKLNMKIEGWLQFHYKIKRGERVLWINSCSKTATFYTKLTEYKLWDFHCDTIVLSDKFPEKECVSHFLRSRPTNRATANLIVIPSNEFFHISEAFRRTLRDLKYTF